MSGDTSNDDTTELDRRNFLKAVGAGVSLSAIDLLSDDEAQIGDITYNPEEEVPYVAGWKNHFDEDWDVTKEPMYDIMSIKQWDQIQSTRDAIDTLSKTLLASELDEDDFLFLQTTDETSPNGRRIDIAYHGDGGYSEDHLRNMFPSTVPGKGDHIETAFDIPIDIRQMDISLEACNSDDPDDCDDTCYAQPNDGDYRKFDDVSGSAPIFTTDNNKLSGCTAGPYVHSTYGAGWITARHVVSDDNDDALGHEVNLAARVCEEWVDEDLGEVEDAYYDERETQELSTKTEIDLAFIEKTASDKTAHEWISSPGYLSNEGLPLTTVIADKELEKVEGNTGWNLNVQGQRTCRSESYVDTVVHDTDGNVIGGLLDDHYTNNTDSGGSVFHERDGEAYICGVHIGCAAGKSYFNTAETTEDYLDGNWKAQ